MHSLRLLKLPLLGLPALVIAFAGCAQQEEIVRYTVPKPHLVEAIGRQEKANEPATDRTLAAMARQGDMAWFFKMSAPLEKVEKHADEFQTFVKSLRFTDDGEPDWTLPEGWKSERQEGGLRYATITAGEGDDAAELTVIPLPVAHDDWEKYVVDNVNRWRGELDLSNIHRSQLSDEVQTVQAEQDLEVAVVDLQGRRTGDMQGRAPFASLGGASRPATPAGPARDAARASPIRFEAPPNWKPGELESARGGFSVRRDAVFLVSEGDKQVEIAITSLPEVAGAVLPNVNRWADQVGATDLAPDDLAKALKPIEIDGQQADYVELFGPPGADQQATLGVIAQHGGKAWFVKLTGDAKIAEQEKERFEQFVRSIRFGG